MGHGGMEYCVNGTLGMEPLERWRHSEEERQAFRNPRPCLVVVVPGFYLDPIQIQGNPARHTIKQGSRLGVGRAWNGILDKQRRQPRFLCPMKSTARGPADGAAQVAQDGIVPRFRASGLQAKRPPDGSPQYPSHEIRDFAGWGTRLGQVNWLANVDGQPLLALALARAGLAVRPRLGLKG